MSWDGLLDFLTMIKDFILSLIDGLSQVVRTLASISSLAGQASWWMPSSVFTIFVVSVTLIVVLRVVGR